MLAGMILAPQVLLVNSFVSCYVSNHHILSLIPPFQSVQTVEIFLRTLLGTVQSRNYLLCNSEEIMKYLRSAQCHRGKTFQARGLKEDGGMFWALLTLTQYIALSALKQSLLCMLLGQAMICRWTLCICCPCTERS